MKFDMNTMSLEARPHHPSLIETWRSCEFLRWSDIHATLCGALKFGSVIYLGKYATSVIFLFVHFT
jgi:hypothetical protein